jgi:signal transduction histidine kinase
MINANRLESDLVLPKASLLEWSSIFQNVFLNAFNAMVPTGKKEIEVSSRRKGREREILIQDTGVGVNLKDSEELFQPFVRRVKISPERRTRGYGGTGLGLTIVRLIARNIGVMVSFVKPEKTFRTAFSVKWREQE